MTIRTSLRECKRWRHESLNRRLRVFARGMIAGVLLATTTFVVGVVGASCATNRSDERVVIAAGQIALTIDALAEAFTPENIEAFRRATDTLLDHVILPQYAEAIRSARDDALEYIHSPDERPWRSVASIILDAIDAYLEAVTLQP